MLQRLVVFCLICSCSIAFAQPSQESARGVYKRAETQFALGHFNEAAEMFEKAFELKQDPVILYDAAQAHRLAGNKQKALVLYQNYLRLFGEQKNRDVVERRIVELKTAIDAERAVTTSPPTTLDKPEVSTTEPAEAPPPPPAVTQAPSQALVVTQAPPEKKPLAKRGWFWGVVAGSVVVVAGAVVLGVVLGGSSSPPTASIGTVKAY